MASTYPSLKCLPIRVLRTIPTRPFIRRDFVIMKNQFPWGLACTEPATQMPVSQITDELVVIQTLRFIYYMDMGRSAYLPWTQLRLYDWMKSTIGAVNIVDALSQGASAECCFNINGVNVSRWAVLRWAPPRLAPQLLSRHNTRCTHEPWLGGRLSTPMKPGTAMGTTIIM